MKTTKEMIEVMKAFDEGKEIQYSYCQGYDKWEDCENPCWNWNNIDYRIKPEKITRFMTLEEIIEWRKNNNGVILWTDSDTYFAPEYVTIVSCIVPKKEGEQIYIEYVGWVSYEDFVQKARKPYGEKFEVEDK